MWHSERLSGRTEWGRCVDPFQMASNGGGQQRKDASGEDRPPVPRKGIVDASEYSQSSWLYEQQQEYGDVELIRMLNQYERVEVSGERGTRASSPC